jgi:hypothetical protein
LAVTGFQDGFKTVQQLARDGRGFAYSSWRNSLTMKYIQGLPAATIIYSNKPTAISLLTDKSAYISPTPLDPATSLARPAYQGDIQAMREKICTRQAVLIYFGRDDQMNAAEKSTLSQITAGLTIQNRYEDAVVFTCQP